VTGIGEAARAASHPLEVIHPCWLIATGNTERVEVLRSPLVLHDKKMFQPVRRYIAEHGLVLAAQEIFDADDWMGSQIEMSVYVPPAVRNASYAEAGSAA